jgi:hypothetical protein
MNFEHSEMLLYHNLIIEESGKFDKALEHLELIEGDICDRRSWKEKRGSNIEYKVYHNYIMLKLSYIHLFLVSFLSAET